MSTDRLDPANPVFTVAIPTCNGQPYIGAALQGILAQANDLAFNLIIFDDRSDDATLEQVRTLAAHRATIHQNPTRLGLAGNWNQCLALTETPFVTIFHQDDVMHPGHLKAHAQAFESNNNIGMVASASTVIDSTSNLIPPSQIPPCGLGPTDRLLAPGELAPLMISGNPLRCSAISLRLAATKEIGEFNPTYRYVLDWDYWLRISRRWHVAWLTNPTVQIRWHPKSETHRFKTGTADLDETGSIMHQLFTVDLNANPNKRALQTAANRNLARAFLNRAHDALHAHQSTLARHALLRALSLSPTILKTILQDPRLLLQMTTLALSPNLATRIFAHSHVSQPSPSANDHPLP